MSEQHLVDIARDHLFVARISYRYHEARQRFFGRISQFFKFVSAFSATTVFFTVQTLGADYFGFKAEDIAKYSGILFGFLQFVDFFASFETKAFRHESLRKDYLALESEITAALLSTELSADDVNRLTEKRLQIETSEGPTLYWLSCRAYNEQILMQSEPGVRPKELIDIPFWANVFIQLRGGAAPE